MKRSCLISVALSLFAAQFICLRPMLAEPAPDAGQSEKLSPDAAAAEELAFRKLANPTVVDFREVAVEDALAFLKDYHDIPIRLDAAALEAAGISKDKPVTLTLNQVPFARTLDRILEPLAADWYVEAPGLVVTTRKKAADAIRSRFEKILDRELDLVKYVCELTDDQRRKLQLAGRGDVRQFLDGFEKRCSKLQAVAGDDGKTGKLLECEAVERSTNSIRPPGQQGGPRGQAGKPDLHLRARAPRTRRA